MKNASLSMISGGYTLSRQFLLRLLSLIWHDQGFGVRIIGALDSDIVPNKPVAFLLSVIKAFVDREGNLPHDYTLKQLLLNRYHDGVVTEEVYLSALKAYKLSRKWEPMPRFEAIAALESILFDSEILQALDECYKLHREKKYEDVFVRMSSAQDKVRLLGDTDMGCHMQLHLRDYCDRVQNGEASVERIPFGIAELDKHLKGGLGRTQLGCIIAPEKYGKSMALAHAAVSALLLGYRVAYISAELDELQIENRIVANTLNLSLDALERGGEGIANIAYAQMDKVFRAAKGNIIVKAFPSGTATVRDIEAYLRDAQRMWDFSPDVLIVDYADELADSVKARSDNGTYAPMGRIYTALRALGAKDNFNCAVWTASQVKRSAIGSQYIEFRDIADSILKAAIVDLMFGLCCNDDEREAGLMRLYVNACRYARFPFEVGPYATDPGNGRLIRLGNDVMRFVKGRGIWAEKLSAEKTLLEKATAITAMEHHKRSNHLRANHSRTMYQQEETTKAIMAGRAMISCHPWSESFALALVGRLH